MPILGWRDSFLLGIQEFDEHHKHLIELLNKTYDEYSHDPAAGAIESIIIELADYATYHFEAEERWMNEKSYPNLSMHKEEHARFSERIAAFHKESLSGQATSSALFFFLAEWLTTHILETDADYAHILNTKLRGND